MKFDRILCRYGELTLKGDFTRSYFEKKLIKNIKSGLKKKNIEFEIEREPGRLFIKTKQIEESCEVLKKVFGLTSISPVKTVIIRADLEKLINSAVKFAKNFIKKDDTFAVRAKRKGNDAFTSQMIERRVGAEIIKKIGSKVNLTNPDKILFIEVRQNKAYFFKEKIKCPGGLPLGTQGKVVSLLSGGIDSAVSTWMMMRRGCKVIPLYINTSSNVINRKRVKMVLEKLNEWSIGNEMKLIEISDYKKVIDAIVRTCKSNLTCLLCKRMMYRIGEKIALKKGADAIVTGESLGQVASQTLANIRVLDQAIDIPVLRPLISFDKEEIIKIAKDIGTYEPSIMPHEECYAVPDVPRTKGNVNEVLEEEKKINIEEILKDLVK
ncbi:MAG: tRNA 4-thiouridine(8) synthase ThiI [Candidatus Aenigmarchaeota archaeon]|nr:tRNA 4-thiouridine(8) synthase ThiI [Candidatus Aenigmarchaeota archaeon]